MKLLHDHVFTKERNGIDGRQREYEVSEKELDRVYYRCRKMGMRHDGGFANLNQFWQRFRGKSGTIQVEERCRLRGDELVEKRTVSFLWN